MRTQRTLVALLLATLFTLTACRGETTEKVEPAPSAATSSTSETPSPTEQPTAAPTIAPTATPSPTQEPERKGDFRVGYWGDDKDTIQKHERASLSGDVENALVYDGCTVAKFGAQVFYYFDMDGKLYQGGYQLTETHSNNAAYLSDYNTLKAALTVVYGEPYEDETITLNNAANYTDEGTALEYGYTAYRAQWCTDNTNVMLGMTSDNYDIFTAVAYEDLAHEDVVDTNGL